MEFFVYNVKTLITWPLHYVLVEIRLRPHPLFVFFWGVHETSTHAPDNRKSGPRARHAQGAASRVRRPRCGSRAHVRGYNVGRLLLLLLLILFNAGAATTWPRSPPLPLFLPRL